MEEGVPCFDVQAACAGFLFATQMAKGLIESGIYKKVLVVCSEKMSSVIDKTDRATLPLFGDGAAAVMFEAQESEYGLLDLVLHNDNTGDNYSHLILKAGGSMKPATHETVDAREHFVYQEGRYVFKHAVSRMGEVAEEIMQRNGLSFNDIDWVVPHQANMRIITATADRINLSMDKVMHNIEYVGNTSSASIPLCLWQWEDRLHKGDNLVLAAFGAGFTWGGAYLKWGYDYKK